MSSAFDTICRELMQTIELILEEDEMRMCRLLLSETSTTLRFAKDITYLQQIKHHHKVMPYQVYFLTLPLRMLLQIKKVK